MANSTKPPTTVQDELRESIRTLLRTSDWTDSEDQYWTATDKIMSLLATALADAEREARVDELDRIDMFKDKTVENGYVMDLSSHEVNKYFNDRYRELRTQAAKPEKDGDA